MYIFLSFILVFVVIAQFRAAVCDEGDCIYAGDDVDHEF